jgi:hypothetical protein
MTAKTKRAEAIQRALTEEKEWQRFIRKKFHRTAEIVVPTTVVPCREVNQDLPALSLGKIAPPGSGPMLEFRKKVIVTRLPFRPLAIKHYTIGLCLEESIILSDTATDRRDKCEC